MNSDFLKIYIMILGIMLITLGFIEILNPLKIFKLWKNWVNQKLFFLHGIMLILTGFPLTMYNSSFSAIFFVIGCIVIFTGPFIIIYPDKFRKIFLSILSEMDSSGLKKLIYTDAFIRISIGIFFIFSYLS